MKILFMLPARSGSKGIRDKNIKKLAGKPLMYYAIHAILESEVYSHQNCYVMVNTDSQNYAEIARQYGANIPYLRDKRLAGDKSVITDTIKDTMKYFEEEGYNFDIFSMIQITSPLITGEDIDRAVEIFNSDSNIDAVNSVTESEIMPLWCNTLPEDLSLNDFIDKKIRKKNRQELPLYYRITGAIRMARWDNFKNNNYDWLEGNVKALVMEQEKSIDIDTELDFKMAEILMKGRKIYGK